MRPGDPRLLTDPLGADDDVREVEMDVREGGQEPGVEAGRSLVALPPVRRPGDLVHAIFGERGQKTRQVAPVLGERVPLPQLSNRLDLGRVDRPLDELAHVHERQYSQSVSHLSAVRAQNRRTLGTVLALTAAITVVEVVGGVLTGSLALLADAVHMLSDNVAISLALVAIWLASRPTTPQRTFGYQRAEILAALANGVVLVALAIWIFIEAYGRFGDPTEVLGGWMLLVALVGLAGNLVAAWILTRTAHSSLNVRAALRHVVADALGSAGVVVAALVVLGTGWRYADPVAGVLIAFLVLASSWSVLRESVHILLEGTPRGIDARELAAQLTAVPGVVDVHDLHIWTITSGFTALAAHVLVEPGEDGHARRRDLELLLARDYGIEHTTLQVEHVRPAPRIVSIERSAR